MNYFTEFEALFINYRATVDGISFFSLDEIYIESAWSKLINKSKYKIIQNK